MSEESFPAEVPGVLLRPAEDDVGCRAVKALGLDRLGHISGGIPRVETNSAEISVEARFEEGTVRAERGIAIHLTSI